jgi:hypothetical protein
MILALSIFKVPKKTKKLLKLVLINYGGLTPFKSLRRALLCLAMRGFTAHPGQEIEAQSGF